MEELQTVSKCSLPSSEDDAPGILKLWLSTASASPMSEVFKVSKIHRFLDRKAISTCIIVCKAWYVSLHSSDILRECFQYAVSNSQRKWLWKLILLGENTYSSEASYKALSSMAPCDEGAILRDLGRTFPCDSNYRGPNSKGQKKLLKVLRAVANRVTDVGYCQGMNFVAGVLLHIFDDFTAYRCMLSMFDKCDIKAFYTKGFPKLKVSIFQLERLLHALLPQTYRHLTKLNLKTEYYCINWFLTILAGDMPIDAVLLSWDQFLFDRDPFIFKAVLALFRYNEENFLKMNFEEALQFLKGSPFKNCGDFLVEGIILSELDEIITQELLTSLETAYKIYGSGSIFTWKDLDSQKTYWEVRPSDFKISSLPPFNFASVLSKRSDRVTAQPVAISPLPEIICEHRNLRKFRSVDFIESHNNEAKRGGVGTSTHKTILTKWNGDVFQLSPRISTDCASSASTTSSLVVLTKKIIFNFAINLGLLPSQ